MDMVWHTDEFVQQIRASFTILKKGLQL